MSESAGPPAPGTIPADLEHEGARLKAEYEEKIAQARRAGSRPRTQSSRRAGRSAKDCSSRPAKKRRVRLKACAATCRANWNGNASWRRRKWRASRKTW